VATRPAEPFLSDLPSGKVETPRHVAGEGGDSNLQLDAMLLDVAPRAEPMRVRHLMYLVVAAALLCWSFVAGGVILFLLAVIGLVVAAISAGFLVIRQRATRQDALLAILALAAEKRIPLAPAVLAFADQYRGTSRMRLIDLAAHLNAGTRLTAALEQARKLVARDAVLLCGVGELTDSTPRALRMAASTRLAQFPVWTAISGRFTYIITLLCFLQAIAGFMFYFIVPKFEAILKDFGLPMPAITRMSIEFSHFLVKYFFPVTGPLLAAELGFLFFLPFSFLSWGHYDIPLFDRMLRRRHSALMLRALGLFVDAGKPISQGLSTLAKHYPTRWVRRRLTNADLDAQHGADWIEAMLHQELIRPADGEVLRAATAAGNLGWALQELAESGERRLAIRFQAVLQTVFPLLVVLLGFFVMWMALTYFTPLVLVISRLATTI
jgi:protein transport protein HofC